MTSSLLRRPWLPSLPTNHSILVTLLSHAQLSNFSCSVLWSSVLCNGSSEKQPRPGPQNTHKGQGPKDTLRVIAVSAVCQRWSPGLIGGALIALQIKPSVTVQRSVSCLFACPCCSDTNEPQGHQLQHRRFSGILMSIKHCSVPPPMVGGFCLQVLL